MKNVLKVACLAALWLAVIGFGFFVAVGISTLGEKVISTQ